MCFATEEECQRYEGTNGILRLFYNEQGELLNRQGDQDIRNEQLPKRVKEAFGRSSYGLSSTIEWLLVAAKTRGDLFRNAQDLPEVATWVKQVAKEHQDEDW